MFDIAKKARAGMKAKAERLASEKDRKVDSSDWSPAEPLNADVKTGMRPVSRRAYKKGGKVVGKAMGEVGKKRADRLARKAGGRVETKGEQPLVDRLINRDEKKANEYRDGKKHVGGMKRGGRAEKADNSAKKSDQYGPTGKWDESKEKWVKKPKKIYPKNWSSADEVGYFGPSESDNPDKFRPGEMKRGGRAKRANGGMTMEEMIEKNPAPAKKPLFSGKIPLPPRRPENETTAVPAKPDMKKALPGDDVTGPPKKYPYKKGGKVEKADGGSIRSQFNQAFKEARAAFLRGEGPKNFEFQGKSYTTNLASDAPKSTGPSTRGRGTTASPKAAESAPAPAAKPTYTPPRVMGTGQGTSTTATPSVTTGQAKDERYYDDANPVNYGASLGNKNGGRINRANGGKAKKACSGGRMKKNDGGPAQVDPRLGIVSPKALNFAQNVVTPGLKKGGRIKKFGGGAAVGAGKAAVPNLAPVPVMPSAAPSAPMPMVGSGLLPQAPTSYQHGPVYDPAKYAAIDAAIGSGSGKGHGDGHGDKNHGAKGPDYKTMPISGDKDHHQGKYARGGRAKGKGKSNINIIIATGKTDKPEQPNQVPAAPMGMPPMPPAGMGAPPPAPQGGPAMPPMGAPPSPGMPPVPRKAGGRVSKVAKSFKDMTAGAGSGEGRLQKTDIAKRAPHKAGGKVYRSYKDMDAGAGSGMGRIEKTEIQSRKK